MPSLLSETQQWITAKCSSTKCIFLGWNSQFCREFAILQEYRVVKLCCQASNEHVLAWRCNKPKKKHKQHQSVLIYLSVLEQTWFFCLFRFTLVPLKPKCSAPNRFIWIWALRYEISLDSLWPKCFSIKEMNIFCQLGSLSLQHEVLGSSCSTISAKVMKRSTITGLQKVD